MNQTTSMAGMGNVIRRWLAKNRPEAAAACTPLEIFRRVYGVEPGQYECTQCRRFIVISDYPTDHCPGCQHFLPRRCTTRGCGEICQPWKSHAGWNSPHTYCRGCSDGTMRKQLSTAFKDAVGARICDVVTGSYIELDGRRQIDDTVDMWVEDGCGRGGGPSVLYAHGPVGTGKTIALARAAYRAMVNEQSVRSMMFVRESELLRAHSERYADSQDVRMAAVNLLSRAQNCELLLVDELFSKGTSTWTDKMHETMTELFRVRFEARRATLITSNEPPMFGRMDNRTESRFLATSRVVEVWGSDRRVEG